MMNKRRNPKSLLGLATALSLAACATGRAPCNCPNYDLFSSSSNEYCIDERLQDAGIDPTKSCDAPWLVQVLAEDDPRIDDVRWSAAQFMGPTLRVQPVCVGFGPSRPHSRAPSAALLARFTGFRAFAWSACRSLRGEVGVGSERASFLFVGQVMLSDATHASTVLISSGGSNDEHGFTVFLELRSDRWVVTGVQMRFVT